MHLLKLRVGHWTFTPGLWPTLAAMFFFVLTMWLGNWQSERADSKRVVQARYDQAEKQAAIHVGNTLLDGESVLHRRVEVDGVLDDAQTILLDNRVYNSVAGYHILTPLKVSGGRYAVLVNRGWVATGRSRDRLPIVPVPPGQLHLEGMAVDPYSRKPSLAESRFRPL